MAPKHFPQQRLFEIPLEEMSDLELMALVLGPGTSQQGAFRDAQRLLNSNDSLEHLAEASYQTLRNAGLNHKRAIALQAADALFKKVHSQALSPGQCFRSSAEIFRHFKPRLSSLKKETFWNVLLDGKNRILKLVRISEGSLTASLAHPREVYRPAIREAAAGVLFVHNHPSGDPNPSQEDLRITKRLVETGKVVGIRVLDHVIIGDRQYFSFADQGLL
jgi:DNA repair protein RadC